MAKCAKCDKESVASHKGQEYCEKHLASAMGPWAFAKWKSNLMKIRYGLK